MTRQTTPFSFPEIRVVEASAGSGKTYALAKRYVQLLINPTLAADEIPLRHILAITFTNKATIEMKERILEFLKKIALDAFPNAAEAEDIHAALGLPKEVARQRAFRVMDHLIRNYNFFQVQTIDSFVNAIVASCAFQLDLSARFTIKTGYRDYLAYSLDSVIDRSERDPAVRRALQEFLVQYLHVENRLGWFPKKSMLALMEGLYAASNTYGGEFVKLVDCTADDIRKMKKDVLEKMRALAARLPAATNKTFAKNLAAFLADAHEQFGIDRVSAFFAREQFPAAKGTAVPAEVDRLWDAIRHGLETLCRAEAYSFYNCYIDIFGMVQRDLRTLTRASDLLFLPELNRQAGTLFARGTVGVPELYYRLATRFRHFLIDEFQDTSELQWKNLAPMAEEVLAAGGSLFYVGDKKQAIYRFRGGDATLFDRIPARFGAYAHRRELLNRNFRSHRAVVAFNNDVFSPENLRRFLNDVAAAADDGMALGPAEQTEILQVFADSLQSVRPGNDHGYVRVVHLEGETRAERTAAARPLLHALLDELRGRFAWRDIAFLARDNSDLELITGWLIDEQVPVASEKTLNLRENPLIKELVSALRFLQSPVDNVAFVSFVTGEMFLGAADLAREAVVSSLGRRPDPYLYRPFREDHADAWNALVDDFFVNVGYLPVYELAVSILGRYRVMERFPEQQVFVLRFLELIKEQEKESTGLGAFLEYFDAADDSDLYVTVTDSDAVSVLTVHKAKGLEFPVVIIPFLEMRPGGTPGGGSFDIADGADGLALVRLNRKYVRFSDELRRRAVSAAMRSFIDELDAVYVALTRPRCELYAFIPARAGAAANPVRLLIPQAGAWGEQRRYEPGAQRRAGDLCDVPAAVYENWIDYLKDEFNDDHRIRNRAGVLRGERLHYALSLLTDLTDVPLETAIADAVARTRAACGVPDDDALAAVLRRIVTAAPFRPFFFIGDGDVCTEQEIIDGAGATRRLDRLIVRPGACIVADYKSTRDGEETHRRQVQDYLSAVRAIYPGRKVRGYLLYLDTLTAEEVTA
jgi:ATP-dependent exoDNAse (exonuclease V) beta subunit